MIINKWMAHCSVAGQRELSQLGALSIFFKKGHSMYIYERSQHIYFISTCYDFAVLEAKDDELWKAT